jgi:transposase-like protein
VAAARRYLERAIDLHGLPDKITFDKSGANTAAIRSVNVDGCVDVELRQSKYLNNMIERDYRAVKRITDPMLGWHI